MIQPSLMRLSDDEIVRKIGDYFRKNAPGHKLSALQDLERGRRLEADATLGFAVRLAAEKGLPSPQLRPAIGSA